MALKFGAYVIKDGTIHGMIYAPFVQMLSSRFGIAAEVVTDVTARDLAGTWVPGSLFLASVHPSIRLQKPPPPKRGGHLVLVTNASAGNLTFHNPSGHDPATQQNARLAVNVFAEFFAGRGVLVSPAPQNTS